MRSLSFIGLTADGAGNVGFTTAGPGTSGVVKIACDVGIVVVGGFEGAG